MILKRIGLIGHFAIRIWFISFFGLLPCAHTAEPTSDSKPARNVDGFTDNSFLVEEAYNQEPGVVQHIFGAFYGQNKLGGADDKSLSLGFTQEWPLFSQTHQFSYTVPYTFARSDGQSTG